MVLVKGLMFFLYGIEVVYISQEHSGTHDLAVMNWFLSAK